MATFSPLAGSLSVPRLDFVSLTTVVELGTPDDDTGRRPNLLLELGDMSLLFDPRDEATLRCSVRRPPCVDDSTGNSRDLGVVDASSTSLQISPLLGVATGDWLPSNDSGDRHRLTFDDVMSTIFSPPLVTSSGLPTMYEPLR